jgi:hypothetical protein
VIRQPKSFVVGVALIAVVTGFRRLSWRSGVSNKEAFGSLPGDNVIPHPMVEWTRGITIRTSPALVWPWLVQMGYHRGGWYTNERVDKLIWRVDARNADRILPECQDLAIGDIVPDGPDHAAYFWVRAVETERTIVYSSIRHPYRGHPIDPADHQDLLQLENELVAGGKYIEFSWTFALQPLGPQATRLLIRTRANYAPTAIRTASIPLGLFDMYFAHSILKGIKRRAETDRP